MKIKHKKPHRAWGGDQETEFHEIDMDMLDKEVERQPGLIREYGERLADARKKHSEAEAELKVVKAEIDELVRKRPDRFGLEKVTEPAIENKIVLSDKHKEQVQEVIDCKHRVDILAAAVKTLEHKKSMVEQACDLWAREYYGEPRPRSREAKTHFEEMDERAKRRNRHIKRRSEDEE